MKVFTFAALFAAIFADVALSNSKVKVTLDNGFALENEDIAPSDTIITPSDISKNITERLEELLINSDGLDIFMVALERVVLSGGETVNIPPEIDPEEHNITIEDALDRTQDFITEQNKEAQALLSYVYENMQGGSDPYAENDDPSPSFSLSRLEDMKDQILEVQQSLADAAQDVADYRRSQSLDQMYNYYYNDGAEDYVEEAEEDEEKEEEEEDDDDESPSFSTPLDQEDGDVQNKEVDDEDDLETADEDNLVLSLQKDDNDDDYYDNTEYYDDFTTKNKTKIEDVTADANDVIDRTTEVFDDYFATTEETKTEEFTTSAESDFMKEKNFTGVIVQEDYVEETISDEDSADSDALEDDVFIEQRIAEEVDTPNGSIVVEQDEFIEAKMVAEIPLDSKSYGDLPQDQDIPLTDKYENLFEDKNAQVSENEIRPTYGYDAIDPDYIVTDEDLFDTKVVRNKPEDESTISDNIDDDDIGFTFSTEIYVAVAAPLVLCLIVLTVFAACRFGSKNRRPVTVRALHPVDAEEQSRVSVIPICDRNFKGLPLPPPTNLPSYLEVICEKVEPPTTVDAKLPKKSDW